MISPSEGWLLMVHSIPPKPPYFRAKVMRRLTQLGALPLKRSAYLLPNTDAALEDLQWLRKEIGEEGGDAWILQGRFLAGHSSEEIRHQFREMRASEYRELAADARALLDRLASGALADDPAIASERRRLHKRLQSTRLLDFFAADGREDVEVLMSKIERHGTEAAVVNSSPKGEMLHARMWATRAGVKVDRMGSAWLIRRFIDPEATFVFVPSDSVSPPGALRFDMFEGEFTHDGNRCTFEVLLDVVGRPHDRGLIALAQIVHDLDVRDERYQRAETAGVGALVAGIVARHKDDLSRLDESSRLFDALYVSLGGNATSSSATEAP